MYSFELFQFINKPTMIGNYSNTIIDNIFTNCKSLPEIIGLFITDISHLYFLNL